MITCSKCGHRAHEGVCVSCMNEYEKDERAEHAVCVTPIAPGWIHDLLEGGDEQSRM